MAKNAPIRSRKHAQTALLGSSLFALSALSVPVGAMAQEAGQQQGLPEVKVKAKREVPYKADQSANNKLTQPLLDTPKTVQVLKKEMLREQGAVSLMDALRNTPGITMQLGENGNTTAGDAFSMRGFSTEGSIFVDGIRDVGGVSRDLFNLEQVEVVKGPSGSETGRGAASGYVNLVTKLPFADTLTDVNVSYGSANRKRASADLNRQVDESTAFRLNVLAYDGNVDGVDIAKRRGTGIAPSIAFGLGTPTRVYLYGHHLNQDDIPSGGISAIGMPGYFRGRTDATIPPDAPNPTLVTTDAEAAAITAGRPVDRSNFYGSRNDYAKVNSDSYSLKSEFDLSSKTTLRNISRFTHNHVDRVLTSVGNINGANIAGGTSGGTILDPSQWTINRARQRINQLNESLVNQTSINTSQTLGGLKHDLVAGLELMSERQYSKGFGSATPNPAANLYNPNPDDVLGVPAANGIDTSGKTVTMAIYGLDTLTLTEAVKLNGGLRVERYKTRTLTTGANPSSLEVSDKLFSWNAGVVFKPTKNSSLYAAAANTLTPPGGNNFSLNTSATNQNSPTMDPQEAKAIELGTKWDLFEQRLNVGASIFRTENDKQASTDSLGVTSQFGKTRVDGVELNAVGQLNNFWQVTAAVTYLKGKQLDQYNASNVQSTGVRYMPKWSASASTSYTFGDFTLGGSVRYLGEQKRLVTTQSPAGQSIPKVPSFEVLDLMAAYKVSKTVNLQLNVYNVLDKEYFTVNNGGNRFVIGAPRAFDVSANFKF